MSKRKLTIAITSVALAALMIVGGTLMWFTQTSSVKNVFTVGGDNPNNPFGAILNEYKTDDNYKAITTVARVQANTYEKVLPGTVVDKDPTLFLNKDSIAAYVKFEITVDLSKIAGASIDDFIFYKGLDADLNPAVVTFDFDEVLDNDGIGTGVHKAAFVLDHTLEGSGDDLNPTKYVVFDHVELNGETAGNAYAGAGSVVDGVVIAGFKIDVDAHLVQAKNNEVDSNLTGDDLIAAIEAKFPAA